MAAAPLDVFGRTFRHINRYREIVAALIKHGFGDVAHAVGAEHLATGPRSTKNGEGVSRPERLAALLAELGPTFIKAGQFLSNRSDLLPEEYLKELAALQDRVPPFPFEQAREIVQAELKAPLEKLFAAFERRPLAAASIAQIHAARLLSGEEVVVKVQRPDIRSTVEADVEILRHMSALMERHLEGWKWRRPTEVVDELGRSLSREMDFSCEAAHLERFAREFRRDRAVRVPRIWRGLSSARVLTMERLEGVKAIEAGALWKKGIEPAAAVDLLMRHFLSQVFVHGFFHADLHPGNVFFLPGPTACYLDYGMMGRLDRRSRDALAALLAGVVARDEPAVAEAALQLAIVDAEPDRRAFESAVGEMLDRYAYRPVKELELGRFLRQLFSISAAYRLRMPPDLFLLAKGLGTLESLARNLAPDFDLVRCAAPFLRRLEAERTRPRALAQSLLSDGAAALRQLRELPADAAALLRQVRKGRLLIEFEHRGLEPLTGSLDRVSNRLSYAVLLAAMIVGSSLLVHARLPPLWHGIPVVGVAGFVLAAVMAVWLLAAILMHGRM